MSTQVLDLYVAFGNRRGNDTVHWILLVVPRNSDRCTYYHVTGGPTRTGYTLQIQANKRVTSFGIASKELVGCIYEGDLNKLKASAQRMPLQRCQRWTCDLLSDLERKGLIRAGTAASFLARIEPSPHESSNSQSAQQPAATQSTSSSSSSIRYTQATTQQASTNTTSDWVWDATEKRYRRWNGSAWIWQ